MTHSSTTITVPDLSAEELLLRLISRFETTSQEFITRSDYQDLSRLIHSDLQQARGKTFRIHLQTFEDGWEIQEGWSLQRTKRLSDNAAALVAWLLEAAPEGRVVSIRNDQSGICSISSGNPILALDFINDEFSAICAVVYEAGWDSDTTLVSFSEV